MVQFDDTIVEFYNCNFNRIMTRDGESHDRMIDCDDSSITMINMTVRDNEGRFMEARGCNVQITESSFRNNKGLELFSVFSNITMVNVTVRYNEGLFMKSERSNVQVAHSDFRNNNGPNIFSVFSNITMMNLTVRDNVGRFLETEESDIQITHSDFINNNGSELFSQNSHITKINLTVIDNEGGFMETEGSNVYITHSGFRNNIGLNHGTVTIESSHLTTVGCQFLENTAKGKGAVVHVSRRSDYNDHGSLFANNTAVKGGKILNK